jgi:hypothetical protein
MNYTKGRWSYTEHQDGAWGSSTDDGIPIPRMSYWLYSPSPEHQCVATFTHKHDVETVCSLLNDPKRAAAPDMYEALRTIQKWLLQDGEIDETKLFNKQFVKANNLTVKALVKAEGK